MVEIVNAVSAGVRRPIQFFHLPVRKPPTDDAYFAPLAGLKLLLWIPRLLRIPGLLWIPQLLRLSRLRLLSIGSG
jgi:hypothetical protein